MSVLTLSKFINLYAAFDIYYLNKIDVRMLPFMLKENVNKTKGKSVSLEKNIFHSFKLNLISFIHI